jgi:hypothetical protein
LSCGKKHRKSTTVIVYDAISLEKEKIKKIKNKIKICRPLKISIC